MPALITFNNGTKWRISDTGTVLWVRDFEDNQYLGGILHDKGISLKIHAIGGCLKPFDRTIIKREEVQ